MTSLLNSTVLVSSDDFRRRFRWATHVAKRGKWIILGCALLVCGPTVLYLNKAERLYTATVEVLIEAPDIGDSLLERSYGKSRLTEAVIQTEAEILVSSGLIEKVVDQLQLDKDPEFNGRLRPPTLLNTVMAYINPLPLLTGQKAAVQELSPEGLARMERTRIQSALQSRLTVRSQRRSFVISVQATANNGEKAARIANTLADLYVVERLETSLEETKRANEWLAQRLEGLQRDVVAAEQAAENFRNRHELARRGTGQGGLTVTDQQLVELNSQLVQARSELAQKQARYNQLRSLMRSQGSVETAYDVLQSSLIQRLREQEAVKQRELSESMKTYGDRHPRIIGQRADLQELREKIRQEVDKITAALASEVEASRAGVLSMEQQIDSLQRSTSVEGGFTVELRELERQAEANRSLYEAFLSRYKRDAEQESIQRANARILSQAAIPTQPSSPRRVRIFFGALLAALVGGIGLVFLLDRLNNRIRSGEEAEQFTGLPLLAVIPRWKPKNAGKDLRRALSVAILDHPRSPLANAFRSLRIVLQASATAAGRRERITLVTSSVPLEGKSFVTRNLAMVVAATGSRVLVIDGDLMRPTQHMSLGVEPQQGLTQALLDPSIDPRSLLLHDDRAKMDILPAGPVSLESGNALANERLVDILEILAPYYDRIFIDAPPSLAATDVQILTHVADQTVFVVRWNHTTRDAISVALSYLTKAGAPVSGVVLSQTSIRDKRQDAYGAYGNYAAYADYARKS